MMTRTQNPLLVGLGDVLLSLLQQVLSKLVCSIMKTASVVDMFCRSPNHLVSTNLLTLMH
jgi:hypothetical protein